MFATYEQFVVHISTIPATIAKSGLVLGILIASLVFLGNVFIVWAVNRDRRLRTRANVFLVSMAVAELVTMVARDIPVLITYSRGRWEFGPRMLLTNFLLGRMRNVLAVEHVIVITLYRYVLIVHGRFYPHLVKTGAIIGILVVMYILPVWVVLMFNRPLLSTPRGIFMDTRKFRMVSVVDLADIEVATLNATSSALATAVANVTKRSLPRSFLVFVFVAFATLILSFLYGHIYFFLRRHSRKLGKWVDQRRTTRHDVRFVKTMALVFIAFSLSYFGLPIAGILDRHGTFSHVLYFPLLLLNWSNACMNWIIYALSNAYFRQNMRRVWTKCGCCKATTLKVSDRTVSTISAGVTQTDAL